MKNFESFWKKLQKELATPKTIKNWTAQKGNWGEDFTAHATPHNTVVCTTLRGSTNTAGMEDFHMVYKNWEGYLSGKILRKEFAKRSFVTKYTISIIHHLAE